ncbi:metal-dependent hydrolase [Candidatus Gottesmanbacteria bacterium]|nr:metal-dependent hydrolase [Candidatus Gottesmanbacteria bacterium]
MTLPTHILAGFIIGKLTGDFPTALAGSLAVDVDHAIPYIRHGMLRKPRRLLQTIFGKTDPWGDQRNVFHSVFSWFVISLLLFTVQSRFGSVFSIAYMVHLVLDAVDGAVFYPFFPFKKFVIKGPVPYASQQEIIFDVCLLSVFLVLFTI